MYRIYECRISKLLFLRSLCGGATHGTLQGPPEASAGDGNDPNEKAGGTSATCEKVSLEPCEQYTLFSRDVIVYRDYFS